MADENEQKQDFGALLRGHVRPMRTEFRVGEKITGVVTAIDRNSVFLDISSKSEAVLDRVECLDADGQLTVKVGDRIEGFCQSVRDDVVRLTQRMSGRVEDDSLQEAYEAGIPVEGKVESERKGGFAVALAGGHAAFCPYSQIDLFKQDAAAYLGQKFLFLIAEYEEFGDNVVLTRRRLLEREREKLLEELKAKLAVGDTRPGVVRRFMPFGVFVDIGSGVEGLVPLRELSWGQGSKPEDFLSVGEEITVVIREIDWEKQRISLGLREAQGDPWGWADRVYLVGKRCEGVVTRLMPFGAFVELERGIEGLVHVSRMGGPRIKRPDELVKIGDRVEVSVESVDLERRRIALAMDSSYGRTGEGKPETRAAEGTTAEVGLSAGSTLAGVVDSIRDFGVFVKLPGGKTGLLHVSQVELRGSSNRIRALHDMFPPGSELQVVIREITGDRVSLTLPETIEREKAEAELRQFQDEGGKALGSLGDVLKGLTL